MHLKMSCRQPKKKRLIHSEPINTRPQNQKTTCQTQKRITWSWGWVHWSQIQRVADLHHCHPVKVGWFLDWFLGPEGMGHHCFPHPHQSPPGGWGEGHCCHQQSSLRQRNTELVVRFHLIHTHTHTHIHWPIGQLRWVSVVATWGPKVEIRVDA